MEYVHIKNLEKYHPGYKDRDLKWAKIYVKMVHGDSDCEMITNETDWGRLVKLILLELQSQKPIPLDNNYLQRKGFDLKKRPISLTLQMLHVFVEICNETGSSTVIDDEEIGNIYFIQAGESGPVKIGYTARPVKYRLQKLQTGNPETIKLLKEIKGTLEYEKALHSRFSAYGLRNEWYTSNPKFLEEIATVTENKEVCNGKNHLVLRREDKSKNKIREEKEEDKKKSFVPPTLEEIRTYIQEKGYNVEPKKFFEYFTEGGWIDGQGNPVRNWKQKIITWSGARKENQDGKVRKCSFGEQESAIGETI